MTSPAVATPLPSQERGKGWGLLLSPCREGQGWGLLLSPRRAPTANHGMEKLLVFNRDSHNSLNHTLEVHGSVTHTRRSGQGGGNRRQNRDHDVNDCLDEFLVHKLFLNNFERLT